MSCCPMSYWCTASGPQPGVESTDGETVYPPEGATAGPYATEEKALLACRGERVTHCAESCPYTVPRFVTLSLENSTGEMIDGQVVLPISPYDPELIINPCVVAGMSPGFLTEHVFALTGYTVRVFVYLSITPGIAGGLREYWSIWASNQDIHDHHVQWVDIPAGYEPWGVGPWEWSMNHVLSTPEWECGTDFYTERKYLGRIQLTNHAESIVYGEADLYVN